MRDFLLFLLLMIYVKSNLTDSVVQTLEGNISGVKRKSRSGRKFLGFQGIPYAEPPVGPLRFRSPVPKEPWTGTLRADKDGSECPQSNGGKEDCLYLNVFTPKLNPKQLLPVMAYIHGGGFTKLNASDINTGPEYLLDKNVVLVTFNYRLGILGFLSTGDAAAPGNFGLKDQRLALQWIQKNIRNFGGNPNDVTLFGQSVGGMCVHLHVFSPKSKDLFKRYIAESGTALFPRAVATDPSYYNYANKVAEMFNCKNTDNRLMIECLRGVDVKQLLNTDAVFNKIAQITHNTKWRPTKEPESSDAFLIDVPENLIRNNVMKDCPVMTGNVKDEGTIIISSALKQNQTFYNQAVKEPLPIIEEFLSYYDPVRGMNLTKMAMKIKDFYLGSVISDDKDTVINQYTMLATDLFFLYPQVQWMNYLRRSSKKSLYFYLFDYRGSLSKAQFLGKDFVSHADELFYIFPIPSEIINPQYDMKRRPEDYKIVDLIVDLWTNFAIKSTPKSNHLDPSDLWQPYSSGTYLQIGNLSDTTAAIQSKFYEDRKKFWYENVPQYSL